MIYNMSILKQGEDMEMKIIKRDGSIVDYNPEKIRIAIKKANKEVSRKEKATDYQEGNYRMQKVRCRSLI